MEINQPTEIQKDNLKIIIKYSDEDVYYADSSDVSQYEEGSDSLEDDIDLEYEDKPLYAKRIESIKIVFPNNNQLELIDYLPKNKRLVGPVEKPMDYDNYEGVISFGNLETKGSLLHLLHEIGHAIVNERYQEDQKDFKVKRERHSWGFALLTFNEMRRQEMDLEPGMQDKQEIKEFIKKSLLSYEVTERATAIMYGEKMKPSKTKYWETVDQDYLDKFIDEMYEGYKKQGITEAQLPKEEIKKSFDRR